MAPTCDELTRDEQEKIRARASVHRYPAGTQIFSEGDAADHIYFIQAGRISIVAARFAGKEEIKTFQPGEFFGEMAVFFGDKRTASALAAEDAEILRVSSGDFLELMEEAPEIAAKVNRLLARRERELILREKLIAATGVQGKSLRIGIKGDPSMRESAFSRPRHESVVDRMLDQLVPRLEELVVRRCVFQVFIGFNSGEIIIRSILAPFSEEIHAAHKLLDEAYVDRHFPPVDYERKAELIRSIYRTVRADALFAELPDSLQQVFGDYYDEWQPLPKEDVAQAIARLPALRTIPNFYLRNCTISTVTDAIHMQFNCDGTHIVSAEEFGRFLEENL